MKTESEIQEELSKVKFLSPNEPMTPWAIERVLSTITEAISSLEGEVESRGKSITMWNQNMKYQIGDIVLLHKTINGKNFAFLLTSTQKDNVNIPSYNMVNGVPDFTKSGWYLLNPMTYLLQDLGSMRKVVMEVFNTILNSHIERDHGLVGSMDIEKNLVKKDYSNLQTSLAPGTYSLNTTDTNELVVSSNGIMEQYVKYSFDQMANQDVKIESAKHYHQRSPIWDESDDTIFAKKYMEDDLYSVTVNKSTDNPSGTTYTNLRDGTNIFHKRIEFETPFLNNEYAVFFDTYKYGQFVFGYDKYDLEAQDEPTYDAIVSQPMMMNKT